MPRTHFQRVADLHLEHQDVGLEDVAEEAEYDTDVIDFVQALSHTQLKSFFGGVKGIGPKLTDVIIDTLGVEGTSNALHNDVEQLLTVKNIQRKKLEAISEHWDWFKTTL